MRNYRPKQVELIEIINKPLLLHLVGYLYYWQMGFNSVFKGLSSAGLFSTIIVSCCVLLQKEQQMSGMADHVLNIFALSHTAAGQRGLYRDWATY